jgi:hypothetical protein
MFLQEYESSEYKKQHKNPFVETFLLTNTNTMFLGNSKIEGVNFYFRAGSS